MSAPIQVSQWLKQASHELAAFDTPKLEADLILCHVLDCDRTALYAWPEKQLTNAQADALQALLARRLHGEPIAYLTGVREFWSLSFDVNKAVLVPRPETELLVELALQALHDGVQEPILDAGTGSGAIAIALHHQWQSDKKRALQLVASDYSAAAIQLAARNAQKLDAASINFVTSDWLSTFSENSFGMIISNPPYLAASDPHLQNHTLDFEPRNALVSGENGLDAISSIIGDACRVGIPGCLVLIEHGYEQASAVQDIMRGSNFSIVQTHKDFNRHDRVTSGYCPKN